MSLEPKNWTEFQHYKNRSPIWIKLHRNLLDNFDFHRLPVASRALAPMLWLLASEYDEGKITATTEEIAFRLRMAESDLIDALKPLIEHEFFISASNLLAPCKQDASPEKRREREREEKNTPDGVATTKDYAFESGIIRLTEKHFNNWQAAFSQLDLKAELIGLTAWAEQQGNRWFPAVSGALAKRNREVKAAKDKAKTDPAFRWNGPIEGVV